MDSKAVNEEFKEWLFNKYPEVFKKYNLAIYKTGEKPEKLEKKQIDINSQALQTIVFCFHKALFGYPNPKYYTRICAFCKRLARRCNDQYKIQKLNQLFNNPFNTGYPLAVMKKMALRDISTNAFRVKKSYTFGVKTKPLRLGDFLVILDMVEDEIIEIFDEICEDNDIPITFNLQNLNITDQQLPVL